jgi:hypothetical protein
MASRRAPPPVGCSGVLATGMKRIMLDQFILLLMAFSPPGAQARVAPQCTPAPGRSAEQVEGEVTKGQEFSKATSVGWILRLVPAQAGWFLQIATKGRETEDLSRLTPPWHFVPNPRVIEGWHFRNADNTSPNEGSLMRLRSCANSYFLHRWGARFRGPWQRRARPLRRLSGSRHSGEVWLHLDEFRLTPPRRGERASFELLKFSACLTWPAG